MMRVYVLIAFATSLALTGCYSRTVEEKPVIVQPPPQPSRTIIVPPGSTVVCPAGETC